jgi:hypothetical protein
MVWSAGELTSADMNTYLPQAWSAWTPAWTATGTAPAIGNGTLSGRYVAVGKTVLLHFQWVAGSTTTYGTGNYRWSLPAASYAHTAPTGLGGHFYGQRGSGYMLFPRFVTSTTFELQYHSDTTAGGAAGLAGQTTPATWASGDFIRGYLFYEAA